MLALPCEAAIDQEFDALTRLYLRGKLRYDAYLHRKVALLDLLADAGLIPDEPKEAR